MKIWVTHSKQTCIAEIFSQANINFEKYPVFTIRITTERAFKSLQKELFLLSSIVLILIDR